MDAGADKSQISGGTSAKSLAVYKTLVCELDYKSPAQILLSCEELSQMPSERLRGGTLGLPFPFLS